MHPSVYAAESSHRPRRVAKKRERRASCSSAPSPSLSYDIPSLLTTSSMHRRSSLGALPLGSSHSTHSRYERRGSCSSTASLSDSFQSVGSSSSMKSCSFREEPLVITITAATTLTGDKNDLWYQKEDFDNFREKTRRIINNVDENGRGKNGKKYCTRGLEKYMARAQESRRLRKSILEAMDEDEGPAHNNDNGIPTEVSKEQPLETNEKGSGSFHKRMLPWRRKSNE